MGLLDAARRGFSGMTRSGAEANELQEVSRSAGATPIDECQRGQVVTACGVLSSVTMRPRAGVPAVEAALYDGTGRLTVVWLGRRHIAGIEAGRSISVRGRVTCHDDESIIFNPRYNLLPRGET